MTLKTQEEALANPETANPEMAMPADRETGKPSLVALTLEAASLARGFLELLILELRLAIQSIPKIIGLTAMVILLAVFAWLSFAATVAWSCAALLGSTGWGVGAFLVLQLLALFTCTRLIRRYVRRLTLPNSRRFLKQLEDALNAPTR